MFDERLLRTFSLALVGLALFAWLRPESPDPREDIRSRETWFFINKTHQPAAYDVVILGDSRGLRGLSPGIMAEGLDDRRIFNLSFHAGGMNPEMYDAAESLLDPGAPQPVIVLAPTALAFMPTKRANAQYHEYRNKPRDLVWLNRVAPVVATWFQPVSPSVFVRRWLGISPRRTLSQTYHADGWIETDQTPRDNLDNLTPHRERLVGQVAEPELVDALLERTAAWTRSGIRVACFFHPAYAPRTALEDSMLNFNRDAFRGEFVEAGGIWLESGRDDYETYDGSHLVAASATRLSRRLAHSLAGHLAPSP